MYYQHFLYASEGVSHFLRCKRLKKSSFNKRLSYVKGFNVVLLKTHPPLEKHLGRRKTVWQIDSWFFRNEAVSKHEVIKTFLTIQGVLRGETITEFIDEKR